MDKSKMDPLTPEEVNLIEQGAIRYVSQEQYLATIRDRERERDEALITLSNLCARNIIEVGELQRERDIAIQERNDWEQANATNIEIQKRFQQQRDELQRKLDAYQKLDEAEVEECERRLNG